MNYELELESKMIRLSLILLLLDPLFPRAFANSEQPKQEGHETASSEKTGDKKKEKDKKKDKEKSKKEKSGESKSEHSESTEEKGPKEVVASTGYVHEWIKFPTIRAKSLTNNAEIGTGSELGIINVVVFMASWCLPCQKISEELKNLETRYKPIEVNFLYVFAHDLENDASAFAREYNINNAILANFDLLKTFHDPELPSIYLSDRQGWIVNRYKNATPESLKDMDNFLKWISAI